jgi:hypothetical protein
VSSKGKYELVVSERVSRLLKDLHQSDPPKCRELALILLRLEKTAQPAGSRELCPEGEPAPGECVWQYGEFTILYRVDETARVVEIGVVRRQR